MGFFRWSLDGGDTNLNAVSKTVKDGKEAVRGEARQLTAEKA